jgi:hypothetical protein
MSLQITAEITSMTRRLLHQANRFFANRTAVLFALLFVASVGYHGKTLRDRAGGPEKQFNSVDLFVVKHIIGPICF